MQTKTRHLWPADIRNVKASSSARKTDLHKLGSTQRSLEMEEKLYLICLKQRSANFVYKG